MRVQVHVPSLQPRRLLRLQDEAHDGVVEEGVVEEEDVVKEDSYQLEHRKYFFLVDKC